MNMIRLCSASLTLFILLTANIVCCSKLKQLQIEINALNAKMSNLEKKVYIEESEMQYELEAIWSQLNVSGMNNQPGSELDLAVTEHGINTGNINQVLRAVEKRSDLMMESFMKEKKLIRDYVKRFENEMNAVRKQQEDSIDDFRNNTQKLLMEVRQSVSDELLVANNTLEDKLVYMQQQLEKECNELKAINTEHFNGLEESLLKQNNLSLEIMKQGFDDLKNVQDYSLEEVKNKTDQMIEHLEDKVNDSMRNATIAQEFAKSKSSEFEGMIQTVKEESDQCISEVKDIKKIWKSFGKQKCIEGGWVIKGYPCYKLFESKVNWEEAVQNCASLNAYLVKIDSWEENEFIAKMTEQYDENIWLGGSDSKSEGEWVWQRGQTQFHFQRWNEGEPNNYKDEDCLVKSGYHKEEGLWNDVPCSTKHYYVCELVFSESVAE